MRRPRVRPTMRVLLVILLAALAFVAAFGVAAAIARRDPAPQAALPARPEVVRSADAQPSAIPSSQAAPRPVAVKVARALRADVGASALGRQLLGRVVDVATGQLLYDRAGTTPAAPASTAKLMTAAAALTVYPATHRFTTRAVAGRGGTVVLVGGGDPTLSAARKGSAPLYAGAARLAQLAAQVRSSGVAVRRIVVDDTLFTGPSVSPAWDPEDVPSSYGAAITPLMTDGGRAAPSDTERSATPDLAAGHSFAALLGHADLPVSRGTAPASAKLLGSVGSAPLGTLVEQMLQTSDNVIADVLARQVALGRHRPASFLGGAAAIRAVLVARGVQVGGGMVDGSGLAASDRVSPASLAAVLQLIATGSGDVRSIVSALPVAGWSGTLADRYRSGPAAAAAGVVRGKTGTLTGVSSLAGLVHDRSGRLLAFSFDADRVAAIGTADAEAALDVLAADLARCGCS